MKRSTWASGSGYVPSNSTGFCVASTTNGRASSCVWTSTVTLRSCMHSSRPDWVFGDARLISSTSTMLAKIGPGRNSKRVSRWLKTFVPTTSAGSRSAVHWTRANCSSMDRASARASVVLPTPGRSSSRMWPSAAMQTSAWSRTSVRTSTAPVSAWATRRDRATAVSSSESATRSGSSMLAMVEGGRARARGRTLCRGALLRAQIVDGLEHRAGHRGLRRSRHMTLAAGGHDGHLVLDAFEADVLPADVVDDDRVEALAAQLVAAVLDRALAVLGGEADERLARPAGGGEGRDDVVGALEGQRQRVALVLLELGLRRLARAVIGDRGRHQHDVRGGERGLAGVLQLGGGRDVDVAHPRGALEGDVRGDHGDVGAERGGLLGQREAHPARAAVADEADGVDRLAGAAGGDEDAQPDEVAERVRQRRLDGAHQVGRLGEPAHAPLALGPERAGAGIEHGHPALAQHVEVRARGGVLVHVVVHRRGDEHGARRGERRAREQVVGEAVGELGD